MQHSRGKSALVFCSTRKGAQEAAQGLSQTVGSLGYSNPFMKSMQQYERLREASLTCNDKQLQSCIVHGGCVESCPLRTHDLSNLAIDSNIFVFLSRHSC
jgi:replicative superfamily II helicase